MHSETITIAEIGENHIGNWDLARKMVVAAAEAGADIVKFQSYLSAEVADDDSEKEWFTKVQLPDELHFELKALAEQHNVEFLSSCFSLNRARFLVEKLGLRKIKVASSEILNFGLLDYLNRHVNTVFVSTGLATLDEVRKAISHLQDVKDIYILQCTTQYPCLAQEANLAVINALKTTFPQHHVGYSDHTVGILAPVIAAALGAEVIEKHFTLDKSLPGTDHVLSATPDEFREMVKQIHMVKVLLGTAVKEPTLSERAIINLARSRFSRQRRVLGIVQARMKSSRLPGKSMIKLANRPIIEHVLRRVRRAYTLTEVILGTSDRPEDNILCEIAERLGIKVFRGPENDVLKRYVLAAKAFGADIVVRICADNPLVAPEEIDRIVMHHLNARSDYSFNHRPAMGNCYPDGLGAEVINLEVLREIDQRAMDPAHREHVTSYIWDHLEDFHVETFVAPASIAGSNIKLDIDTETDLERLERLFNEAPCDIDVWSAEDIVRTYWKIEQVG